ncbi:hypothetical protein [Marinobacterium arenosum]|uniref:hypothetical protein n=1 Tax=Marinobacterium arenosum TaxID=2862496 RepID=UPI001C949E78|nr:hypothetical protein [Marinobacterium arenosum]MBY4676904.1 hypothetical protein [Marinobacterium arenosum]
MIKAAEGVRRLTAVSASKVMKKGPDLVVVLVLVFVIGSVMTGVTHADFQFASLVEQVLNKS